MLTMNSYKPVRPVLAYTKEDLTSYGPFSGLLSSIIDADVLGLTTNV